MMDMKQKIALIAPLILTAMMYPIFQFLAAEFGDTIGWFLGLVIYWLVWGAGFSVWMIGKANIWKIVKPQKPTLMTTFLVLFPVFMASLYRFVSGFDFYYQDLRT